MTRFFVWLISFLCVAPACAEAFDQRFKELIETCIECHDSDTETRLNLEKLDHDLTKPAIFQQWEKVFDRISTGEMPPQSEDRPDTALVAAALKSLGNDLRKTNLDAQRIHGRVVTRRLTRREYEHTLHDLLGIGGAVAKHLPPESGSGTFDTVSDAQGISPVHIRGYLNAADLAIDEAIQLGRPPVQGPIDIDYIGSPYTRMWVDRPLRRGGNTVKILDHAWVTFDQRPHVSQSNNMGYRPRYAGTYRITAEVYGYQAKTPVACLLMRGSQKQGGVEMMASFDLEPGEVRTIEFTNYFTPDDYFYPAPADHDAQEDGKTVVAGVGAMSYKGEGLAVKWLKIEGPLEEDWPPARTRELFKGTEIQRYDWGGFGLRQTKRSHEHLAEILERLAPLAFRRPVEESELQGFIDLADDSIAAKQPLQEVVRKPLRAMFSSPQFMFHSGQPGPLEDHSLATRLSYFLWKSLPDAELFAVAKSKRLLDPEVLAGQVDRMLDDEKSDRFVQDFLGQWLRLYEIDATTPDEKLYPEYEDTLRQAMLKETQYFFRELIRRNLSVRHLIDADFTFLNRRLAEHYGVPDVRGEQMRKVTLPDNSPRGGILTQAAILKITANGTVTSPVKRGNFVLASLLGTPPSPPPPDIGSIEPDTRGTTTIRETLDKHRNVAVCANCHRHIDPPGFAMECFDPIGGFRTRYRSTGQGDWANKKLLGRDVYEYRLGPEVDTSGTTARGDSFGSIHEFKQLLLNETDNVGRNIISQLVVYSTGGELQFADREEIDRIVRSVQGDDYPLRKIIHEVVQSHLFRNK